MNSTLEHSPESDTKYTRSTDKSLTPLLDTINSPADLRALPVEKLPQVCDEIRSYLISCLSENPGHFGSSMGAVDIIVALHYVFDTPHDRLVWDVGHQAYAHKLLTGRREAFRTQRTRGGISGFPNPMESEADTFVAGHAGNSISAALGMAIADKNTPGSENRKTVAVVGDASISGGLPFEGLNNASNNPNDLLIVLNDNNMSIDDNVGALHKYLSGISTSKGYNRWRLKTADYFRRKGILNDQRKGLLIRFNNSIKALVSGKQNIFEGLNIRYFGPFDGHDVIKMVKILREIKDMQGPRLLHICTVKGKGFPEAERNPAQWHAPGKFVPATGEKIKKTGEQPPLWQEVFGDTIVELAQRDDRVMGITAAMVSGTSMGKMLKTFPKRTFDVGISEGHAVTFAGGLAAGGKRPFVAIYSSFLQRAYDNIIHDVAIQGLPVTFCIDRAGVVGEDGVTHHGVFDLAYLQCIPGIAVASPSDERMMRNLMYTSLEHDGPMAIRYPRGKAFNTRWHTDMEPLPIGKGVTVSETPGNRIAIATIGPIAAEARKAAEALAKEGIGVDLYDMIWLKPLDRDLLRHIADIHDAIVTVEDGSVTGGFGSAVALAVAGSHPGVKVENLGIPDRWIAHATVDQLHHECGYDAEGIAAAARRLAGKG